MTSPTSFLKAFDAKYPKVLPLDSEDEPEATLPLSFYDRHLCSTEVWKSIVEKADIVDEICALAEEKLEEYLAKYPASVNDCPSPPPQDSVYLSTARKTDFAYHAIFDHVATFPSRLLFLQDLQKWLNIFFFVTRSRIKGRPKADFFDELDLTFPKFDSSWDLDQDLRGKDERLKEIFTAIQVKGALPTVKELLKVFPRIATWHLFPSGKLTNTMITDLSSVSSSFWETCKTQGSSSKPVISPQSTIDADTGFIHSLPFVRSTRYQRTKWPTPQARESILAKQHTADVSTSFPSTAQESLLSSWALQHAWATAVDTDATFMIFHSGESERIGFRHRKSRTLFLSPLIEPEKDPRYGQLQVGLYIAIIEDVLRRLELKAQFDNSSTPKTRVKRSSVRPAEEASRPTKKRRIALDDTARNRHKRARLVAEAMASKQLALVYLDYRCYYSPVPSSFIRVGPSCADGFSTDYAIFSQNYMEGDTVSEDETFSIALGEPISSGVGGIIHPATFRLVLPSGEVVTHPLILKMAVQERHKEDLVREYRKYNMIARRAHPRGILTVHGLFRDSETGVLGMLMEHGGESLAAREVRRSNNHYSVSTTGVERFTCIRALKTLHRAGFLHGDVHMGNVLLNETGDAYVIDLNEVEECAGDVGEAGAREVDRMRQLLLGANRNLRS